jgi:hypothetical protein
VAANLNHALDAGSLTAIDVHVHAEVSSTGQHSLGSELEQASARYFKTGGQGKPKPGVREKILKLNAARLLGLAG